MWIHLNAITIICRIRCEYGVWIWINSSGRKKYIGNRSQSDAWATVPRCVTEATFEICWSSHFRRRQLAVAPTVPFLSVSLSLPFFSTRKRLRFYMLGISKRNNMHTRLHNCANASYVTFKVINNIEFFPRDIFLSTMSGLYTFSVIKEKKKIKNHSWSSSIVAWACH